MMKGPRISDKTQVEIYEMAKAAALSPDYVEAALA